jgi:hypothetical protein
MQKLLTRAVNIIVRPDAEWAIALERDGCFGSVAGLFPHL